MKAVLISIRPEWCEKILNGDKTIEVRKTRPKIEPPFKCYIYCTTNGKYLNIPISRKRFLEDYKINGMQSMNHPIGNGKVIGEFVVDNIYAVLRHPNIFAGYPMIYKKAMKDACMSEVQLEEYSGGKDLCGWHISDLWIYDEPKGLWKFCKPCDPLPGCDCDYCRTHGRSPRLEIARAPQSWCYVEELH